MNAEGIAAVLAGVRRLGRTVVFHDETDSTNTRALDDVRARRAADGALHVASRQTAGRGSGGTAWAPDEGLGLAFSVVLLDDPGAGPLPFLAAVAATDELRERGIDAHLKWPNDVLIADRKIAGVLIEALREKDRQAWVVGVGVNVNQLDFPPDIAHVAISARQCTGAEIDRTEVLGAIVRRMDDLSVAGDDLVDAFRERCRMLGRPIAAVRDGTPLSVTAVDVDRCGHLVVDTPSGGRETWISATGLDISPHY